MAGNQVFRRPAAPSAAPSPGGSDRTALPSTGRSVGGPADSRGKRTIRIQDALPSRQESAAIAGLTPAQVTAQSLEWSGGKTAASTHLQAKPKQKP